MKSAAARAPSSPNRTRISNRTGKTSIEVERPEHASLPRVSSLETHIHDPGGWAAPPVRARTCASRPRCFHFSVTTPGTSHVIVWAACPAPTTHARHSQRLRRPHPHGAHSPAQPKPTQTKLSQPDTRPPGDIRGRRPMPSRQPRSSYRRSPLHAGDSERRAGGCTTPRAKWHGLGLLGRGRGGTASGHGPWLRGLVETQNGASRWPRAVTRVYLPRLPPSWYDRAD